MGSDAILNAHVCAFPKDSSKKKKRGNNLAKNKLDFERQPCLMQVTSKEYIMEPRDIVRPNCPSVPKAIEGRQKRGNLPRSIRRDDHDISWMSSSSGSCSSSCSEEDREKGGLDDWEALNVVSNRPILGFEKHIESDLFINRAWSPDDVFRPRSLPRISRQGDNMIKMSGNCVSRHSTVSSWPSTVVQEHHPSACPICYEDLDVTESSFIPCPCGFRLCLFCHKKIIEVDGRCPGCRKQYGSGDVI